MPSKNTYVVQRCIELESLPDRSPLMPAAPLPPAQHVSRPNPEQGSRAHCEYKPSGYSAKYLCLGISLASLSLALIVCYFCIPLYPQSPHRIRPNQSSLNWIRQGKLIVRPSNVHTNDDLHSKIRVLDEIISGYPSAPSVSYTDCWFEPPTQDKPCFFDKKWLQQGSNCTAENHFGFLPDENGNVNPCFLFQISNAHMWKPQPTSQNSTDGTPGRFLGALNPSFVPIGCKYEDRNPKEAFGEVTFHPSRGFPIFFFPQPQFGQEYLPPSVWVQVHGVKFGSVVTLQCWVHVLNGLDLEVNKVQLTVNNTVAPPEDDLYSDNFQQGATSRQFSFPVN